VPQTWSTGRGSCECPAIERTVVLRSRPEAALNSIARSAVVLQPETPVCRRCAGRCSATRDWSAARLPHSTGWYWGP